MQPAKPAFLWAEVSKTLGISYKKFTGAAIKMLALTTAP